MSLLPSGAIETTGYDINNSLRFRSAASSYLLRTPASAGNRQIMTYSFWVKRGAISGDYNLTNATTDASNSATFYFNSSNSQTFDVFLRVGGTNYSVTTSQVFRDPSSWYHIVVAIDTTQATASNRTKVYVNGTQVTAFLTANYVPQNSNLALNNNVAQYIGYSNYFDGYMAEINFVDGSQLTPSSFGETDAITGVWKAKKYTGTYGTNGFYLKFLNDANSLSAQYGAFLNGSSQFVSLTPTSAFNFSNNNWTIESFVWPNSQTNQVLFNYGFEGSSNRAIVIYYTGGTLNLAYSTNGSNNTDTSFGAHNMQLNQWNHIAVVRNGTTITAYVNGVPLPTTITIGTSSINYPGTSGAFRIGRDSTGYLNAFVHGFRIVNGTAVYTSKFKPTTTKLTAITNTQLLTLQDATLIDNSTNNFTLTNNGSFTLDFGVVPYASPSIASDYSGNVNNWLIGTGWNVNDISDRSYCVMYDSPTLTSSTVGNYCTLNPLPYYGGYNVLSQGNLQFTSGNSNWMRALATFALSSGKWYWEVTANHTQSQMHGITHATQSTYSATAQNWVGFDATGYAYFSDNGTKYNSNSGVSYGATYGAGDIIGIAFDADNGKLYFSKNGVFQASGDPAAGTNAAFTGLTSGPYVPAVSVSTFAGANTCDANFGQRPFAYTLPTGFNRLNTYNLPDSTIKKGNRYMDATLYTGTRATQVVTNAAGFKPDMVWCKGRSFVSQILVSDSVRGTTKQLFPPLTVAEQTDSTMITAFNSNGFTLGDNSGGPYGNINYEIGGTHVAWQWQAGQGSTSSNTSGSITSTVSVNTTAGFSVATWTAPGSGSFTVGHGLGVAPKFIITKVRNTADSWLVWHTSIGANGYLLLNLTNASASNSTIYNGTPSATLINYGSYLPSNGSTYVTYSWAEIAGFSKFGSYTGNGSSDGPFIYTGFRPTFIIRKQSSGVGDWIIFDNARNPYNVETTRLLANTSNGDQSPGNNIDVLSNGWKERNSDGYSNASGQTYIYMAFAENPFKNANAR